VLGDNIFKQQIEQQTGRRASPLAKGGDRKSESYEDQLLTRMALT
jgi:putative transposase